MTPEPAWVNLRTWLYVYVTAVVAAAGGLAQLGKALGGRRDRVVLATPAPASATLLDDGYAVRISGQDSRRGTFSVRASM